MQKEIDVMLAGNIIEKSESPWTAPVRGFSKIRRAQKAQGCETSRITHQTRLPILQNNIQNRHRIEETYKSESSFR